MRTELVTQYVAFDGQRFKDAATCRAYERDNVHLQLVGLTVEQVTAAMTRTDIELADALELVGDAIKRARLDSGELKRKRKGSGGESEAAAAEDAGGAQSDAPAETRESA